MAADALHFAMAASLSSFLAAFRTAVGVTVTTIRSSERVFLRARRRAWVPGRPQEVRERCASEVYSATTEFFTMTHEDVREGRETRTNVRDMTLCAHSD